MRNCFSLRHTSSHNELILSCGDSDQSPILYRQWLDALVAGIESQGGCPQQQQQEEEEDNCLWMGWTYKKGVNNTAWKKRFIRLTSASVTFVEYPLSFACIACGLTSSAGTTPTRLPNPAKGRSTSRRFYLLISNRCFPVRISPRSRSQSSQSRPALTPPAEHHDAATRRAGQRRPRHAGQCAGCCSSVACGGGGGSGVWFLVVLLLLKGNLDHTSWCSLPPGHIWPRL